VRIKRAIHETIGRVSRAVQVLSFPSSDASLTVRKSESRRVPENQSSIPICHPKGSESDGASAERHAPSQACLSPLQGAAPLRSKLHRSSRRAKAMDLMPDARGPAGLFLPPRPHYLVRHSTTVQESSCAPRSPSSELSLPSDSPAHTGSPARCLARSSRIHRERAV